MILNPKGAAVPKPYDKTTHDGKTVDWLTHCALLEAEIRLGYRLTIVQGSYHKGVGASAGTHDGGGVIDLAPWDHVRKVRVLRDIGFAIWHRPAISGLWAEHCHGVLIGNAKLSPAAAAQIPDYLNHRDGLAGHHADPTYRPNPIPTYKWPGSAAALALEKKAADLLDKKPVQPTPTTEKLAGDWSFAKVPAKAAAAAGLHGVGRYFSGGASDKDIHPSEVKYLHDAGLWWFPFWEKGAQRATEGKAAGRADMLAANAQADAIGYPRDSVIVLTVDFDGTLAQVQDYFAGANEVKVRPIGVYGSGSLVDAVIAAGLAEYGVESGSTAWGGGKRSRRASLRQRNYKTVHIKGVADSSWDEIVILGGRKKMPVWNPGKAAYKPPPPPPPPPVVTGTTLSVTYCNVKSNPKMPQADVVHDIAALTALLAPNASPVWLGAEIAPQRYKDAWSEEMTTLDATTRGTQCECPVSLRPEDFIVSGNTVRLMHKGRLLVTPARYLNIVRARAISDDTLRFAFMSSHFISGAWSDKQPLTKTWRQGRWNTHWDLMCELVKRHVAGGYTVVIGFDANRITLPKGDRVLHPDALEVAHSGIDHLFVIPAAGRMVTGVVPHVTKPDDLKTDHNAITATFTIS